MRWRRSKRRATRRRVAAPDGGSDGKRTLSCPPRISVRVRVSVGHAALWKSRRRVWRRVPSCCCWKPSRPWAASKAAAVLQAACRSSRLQVACHSPRLQAACRLARTAEPAARERRGIRQSVNVHFSFPFPLFISAVRVQNFPRLRRSWDCRRVMDGRRWSSVHGREGFGPEGFEVKSEQ